MPVTPLHIGIPGLLSYRSPKKIDIISAILGSTLVDLDLFLFLILGTNIHGYLHTFIGASILGLILIIVIRFNQSIIIKLKKWFAWEVESDLKSISIGTFLGTYSHILLDGLIYKKMDPFYPIKGNPFFIDNIQKEVFLIVYALAGVTTTILIILYSVKYAKIQDRGQSRVKK